MKQVCAAVLLVLLAACGVDGAPQAPADGAASAGVVLSGDARIGVAGRF